MSTLDSNPISACLVKKRRMTVWREVEKLGQLASWSPERLHVCSSFPFSFGFFLWTKINHGRYYDYVKLSIKIFIRFSFSLNDVYLCYCLKELWSCTTSVRMYITCFFSLSNHYRYPFLLSAINNVLPYHEYVNAILESLGRIYSLLTIISSNFGWVCTK